MVKKLFPIRHVMGYIFSLVLTVVALSVLLDGISFAVGMTILLVCATIQAGVQLFMFMHINEHGETKSSLYINIGYALFVALATVFGTLLTMIWGYN